MIEPIMYFGIGFLFAALFGLVVIPLVHGRAVRLTMRRLEAATPLSMAEIQADKDQLRAEFAMSTRRLEMSVEQLKAKTTSQFAELGKKGDAINRLKIELGEKTAAIFALEARDKALRDQLRATEDEVSAKTSIMHEAERTLSDKEAELAKLVGALDERSILADTQKAEIDTLKTQVEAFKERARRRQRRAQGRGRPPRCRAGRTQSRHSGIGRRARPRRKSHPARRRARTATGGANQGSRTARPSAPRTWKTASANKRGCSIKATSNLTRRAVNYWPLANPKTTCAALSPSCTTAPTPRLERFKAEKAQLQSDLSRATDERDRLARDLGTMKREAEENWATERVENALLRERINDVAAEVARLASTLEGPNSPIDAILAAETARDRADAATGNTGAEFSEAASTNGDLADRIRALQGHASRVPRGDKPTSRN